MVAQWTIDNLAPNYNPGTGRVLVVGQNFVQTADSAADWFRCKFNTTASTSHSAASGQRLFDRTSTTIVPVRTGYGERRWGKGRPGSDISGDLMCPGGNGRLRT